MDLILWRHAEAEEAAPGEDDLKRALTSKGERQAERMAELAQPPPAAFDARPRQPGAALPADGQGARAQVPHRRRDRPGRRAPRSWSPSPAGPMRAQPVLVVGHQPTLGMAAALLLGGAPQPWAVKKGAVWWLRHRLRSDDGDIVLHAVQSPDGL